MALFLKRLATLLQKRTPHDKELIKKLRLILGYRPYNLNVFKLALLHSSSGRQDKIRIKESYERLEYLGDAILGAVVADYLFKKYPYKSEGFLTNIRSRIVSRESLNQIARKIGIQKLILMDKIKSARMHKSIYGNTLEALIAAVYIDRGYRKCRSFILKKVVLPNVDIKELVNTDTNYKSKIIEWTQKEGKRIDFATIQVNTNEKNIKEFTVEIRIDNEAIEVGHGLTKKKAEQNAAFRACEKMEIN